MSEPRSTPQSPPPEAPSARRRARQKRTQGILRLLGIPGGIGIAPTVILLNQGEWWLATVMGLASIGVIVLAIFAKFFSELGNKILDRLEERLEETTDPFAEWIVAQMEAAAVRLWWHITPQFRGAYYQSLIYEYRTYRPQGLKTPGEFSPDLDKVFVPLRVTAKSLEDISPALIQRQEALGDLEIWDFLAESKQQPAYQRIVVIGAPGSGKTTLLRHITLTYAHNTHRSRSRKVPTLVPVLLSLDKVRKDITTPASKSLPDLIVDQVKKLPKGHSLNLSPQWFESKLLTGQCLVMLDGLDEVADEAQRRQVSGWVDIQMRAYPEAHWILTSRPDGYRSAQLTEARATLAVQSFSLGQMEQFLQRWYLQTESLRQVRKLDPGVRQAASTKAHDLIDRIKNYPPLAAMALNPLLLTMIATVHDNRGALPGSRVDLYDEICDVLLVRRQEAKGLTEPFPLRAEQKKSVLQGLALALMEQEQREFTLDQGLTLMGPPLGTVAVDTVTPAHFLEHVKTVSGLLQEREVGVFQFAHLSFQEYLASAQIKETGQTGFLVQNIQHTWWHETIRLYAAKNDTTELVAAALQQPSITTLTIAYDCLEEGKSLHPATRQQLEEMSLEAADPAVAKLAAEVKLARRLARFLRIDDTVQIDPGLITEAEFQLFLEERPQFGPGRPDRSRTQPATGMTLEAALEFCTWLSTWEYTCLVTSAAAETGLYRFYRLPTSAEINRVPGETTGQVPVWTSGSRSLIAKGLRLVKHQLTPEYYPLYRALEKLDFEAADQATTELIQPAPSQRGRGSEVTEMATLPCSRLQTLDWLWVHYSAGRQGLGMQASLWETTPGTEVDQKQQRFSQTVGWQLSAASQALAPNPLPGRYPRQSFSANLLRRFADCGLERGLSLTTYPVVTVTPQGEPRPGEWKQTRFFGEDLGKGVSLEMVAIPGGTFLMGSLDDEAGRYEHEGPQHEVTVPSFFMGKCPVTQAQWRQVAALPRVNRRLNLNPSRFKGHDHNPVERVSWEDAVEFCERLSIYTGRTYRLPSEAEWEYACRAGTTTPFHFGETITTDLANYRGQDWEYKGTTYAGNYGEGPYGSFREKTIEVGQFSANGFGLYDMHGQVWEWCQDVWHDRYAGAPTDGSAWVEGGDQDLRSCRGGSWVSYPRHCRSAYRDRFAPAARNVNIGFRVVCVVAPGLP